MTENHNYQELLARIALLEEEVRLFKERETVIADQEKTCRELFEKAPISYQSLDVEGRFIEVNQTWLDTLGYTRDEVIGRSFADFLHPDLVAKFRENFPRFKAIGEIHGIEFEMVKKDGSTILVSFNGRIGKDSQGNFAQTYCVFDDISARKRAERELFLSEKRFRTIFEQAAAGIAFSDINGKFVLVNDRFSDFLGYTQEELLQLTSRDVTYPDDIPVLDTAIDDLINGLMPVIRLERRYLRKDGSVVWGQATASLISGENGQSLMVLGIVLDIHGQKMAEKALFENQNRHRIIFENSPMGMIFYNRGGDIIDCNAKFIELMGSSREHLIGFNTARQTTNPKVKEAMTLALAGTPSVYEGSYTSVTGEMTRYLRASFNPVTPGKSPTDVITCVEDISERILAENALARRILSLTQPLEEVSSITFEELFNLDDIQLLQDQFASATGVASIITRPDGTPITRPSNFTKFCKECIRPRTQGAANCHRSDANLGRPSSSGPRIETCMSGGLWDAGAGISVGGRHIANWLIGQVRDETQNEEAIRRYAQEIGADEKQTVQAYYEVPSMSFDRFTDIANALYTLANRLSATAYQNVQQARVIADLKRTQDQLQINENRLRFALEGANDGLWDAEAPNPAVFLSRRSFEILGYPTSQESGTIPDWRDLVHPDDLADTTTKIVAHFKRQSPILRIEHRLRTQSGDWKWVLIRGKVVEWTAEGRAQRLAGTLTDIDNRKKIEEAQAFLLEQDRHAGSENYFQILAKFLADRLGMNIVCIDKLENDKTEARMVVLYIDGVFREHITYPLQGTPCGASLGKNFCYFEKGVSHLFPEDKDLQEMQAEGYIGTTLWNAQGEEIGLIALMSRHTLPDPSLAESLLQMVSVRAAAELQRREVERERTILHNQLLQAQKMESVGRLAGGVAHDFNNMLGVILGHVEMAEEQVAPDSPLGLDLKEIKKAATRSADLTRQLLAFARKQTVSPRVLNLNKTVESLLKMLRRLIGEDISLAWLPGNALWQVKIDPGQIDHILANLAINARDAILGHGKIVIQTANVTIDEEYCSDHVEFVPGQYVLIAVSDDGCGMTKDVRDHIFEPFFTTKEVGKGTGLGLATIYGIVKQNAGFISVYSEPGKGTTFKIYFPRHIGQTMVVDGNSAIEKQPYQGAETVLLVEDEPSILQLSKRMLERMGHRVLAAATPSEAIWRAEEHPGEIHLLLSDVIMPEMNGRELAGHILSIHPNMKRLFMSGYTADIIADHGVLEEGVEFIEKPFTMAELTVKIKAALKK